MSAAASSAVTPERILQMTGGYVPPLVLEAAIHHRVFDVLDQSPKNLTELCLATGGSQRGLAGTSFPTGSISTRSSPPAIPTTPSINKMKAPASSRTSSPTSWLSNGNECTTLGVSFVAGGSVPTGYSDTGWFFVQVINTLSRSFTSSLGRTTYNLQPGLDTSYPYLFSPDFSDTPGISLDSTKFGNMSFKSVGEKSLTYGFTVYLLWDPSISPSAVNDCEIGSLTGDNAPVYTPSNCSSIPVPLEAVNWGFSGDAVETLNPAQNAADGSFANTWYLTNGSAATPTYSPGVYPIWSCTENAAQINMSIPGTCVVR